MQSNRHTIWEGVSFNLLSASIPYKTRAQTDETMYNDITYVGDL